MQVFIDAAPNHHNLRCEKIEASEVRAKQATKSFLNAVNQMGLALMATEDEPRCRGRSKVDLAARAAASS